MVTISRLIAAGAIALSLWAAGPAAGATPPDAAKDYMHKLATTALDILSDKTITLSQREDRVRTLLGENLAIAGMGQFVVGADWRSATEEQRTEYQALFKDFVTLTYAKRLGGYSGEKFTISSVKSVGPKQDALVTTTIHRPSGPPLAAGWRIRTYGESFKILDVMVEGISMLVAQRADFKAILSKGGMQGLIETLRAKVSSFGVKPQ
jgi:phospholipid transport system substrate-binding protein